MKIILSIIFLLSIEICSAKSYTSTAKNIRPLDYDVSDVATEIVFLRPLGFIGSIAGAAVFLGSLPFSLLATIAPPHDAIDKVAKTLIIGPANATFQRPFAYYHYDPQGVYPKVSN